VRERGAVGVVVAVPVGPPGWQHLFAGSADHCVCLVTPRAFHAVGVHYQDFTPTTDSEVTQCLRQQ
jgi:putative phosphoribosyl transferase